MYPPAKNGFTSVRSGSGAIQIIGVQISVVAGPGGGHFQYHPSAALTTGAAMDERPGPHGRPLRTNEIHLRDPMMKTSIKALAFTAALAAGVAFHSPAAAQQGQGGWDGPRREQGQRMDPAQRTERRVQQLTQQLHLSSAQQGQIRGILQREQQQFEQFRGARGQDRQQGRRNGDDAQRRQGFEQMRQLRQQTDQQIERVLTSQQKTEYRRLQQERQQRMRDGRDGQNRQGGRDWSGQR